MTKPRCQIYLDGKLDLENKNAAGVGSTDNEADLKIGRYNQERYSDGLLDELRLWRKALTAKEAKQAWDDTLRKLFYQLTQRPN